MALSPDSTVALLTHFQAFTVLIPVPGAMDWDWDRDRDRDRDSGKGRETDSDRGRDLLVGGRDPVALLLSSPVQNLGASGRVADTVMAWALQAMLRSPMPLLWHGLGGWWHSSWWNGVRLQTPVV